MGSIEYQPEAPLVFASPESAQQAAAVAQAFLADTPSAETPEPPVAAVQSPPPSQPAHTQPAAVAAPETSAVEPEPFDFAAFEPQLSPDLEALLEEEEDVPEPVTFTDSPDDDPLADPLSEEDPAVAKLRKRNEFLEQRLVESNRGKWVAENQRAYPLVAQYAADELKNIQATSRRAFAREAAKLNARVTAIAKPLLDDLGKRLAATGDQVTADRRAQVDASWGVPAVDPTGVGSSAEYQQKIQNARKSEDLTKVFTTMIETTPLL